MFPQFSKVFPPERNAPLKLIWRITMEPPNPRELRIIGHCDIPFPADLFVAFDPRKPGFAKIRK
jgi:hypothetical protein